jgi:hypothetical protein
MLRPQLLLPGTGNLLVEQPSTKLLAIRCLKNVWGNVISLGPGFPCKLSQQDIKNKCN